MKKVFAILFISALIFSLFGCSDNVDIEITTAYHGYNEGEETSSFTTNTNVVIASSADMNEVIAASVKLLGQLKKDLSSDEYFSYYSYSFIDFDFDGTPELVFGRLDGSVEDGSPVSIYKYSKGKMSAVTFENVKLTAKYDLCLYYDKDTKKPVYIVAGMIRNGISSQHRYFSELSLGDTFTETVFAQCDSKSVDNSYVDGEGYQWTHTYSVGPEATAATVAEYNEAIFNCLNNKINMNLHFDTFDTSTLELNDDELSVRLAELYKAFSYDKIKDDYSAEVSWASAYSDFILKDSEANGKLSWSLFDIDGNDIPELFLFTGGNASSPVYTLTNGAVTSAGTISASGLYKNYLLTSNTLVGINSFEGGGESITVYIMSDGKITVDEQYKYDGKNYTLNDKTITESTFKEEKEMFSLKSNMLTAYSEYTADAVKSGIVDYVFVNY